MRRSTPVGAGIPGTADVWNVGVPLRPASSRSCELAQQVKGKPTKRAGTCRHVAAGAKAGHHDPIVIVGAGPVGVFAALVLARRGFRRLQVFDRLPEPPRPADTEAWGDVTRSYNLGLGGRGQVSLAAAGAMERVDRWCMTVVGRKDWPAEGGEPVTSFTTRKYLTKVIARDRLTSCLLEELREQHPEVELHFNVECQRVTFQPSSVELELNHVQEGPATTSSLVSASWVVGADGVRSTVRREMEQAGANCASQRLPDRRKTLYRTIPIPLEKGAPADFNLSVRNGDIGIEALPNVEEKISGVVLFPGGEEDSSALSKCSTGAEARAVFEDLFPSWPTPLLTDEVFEDFAARKDSNLPQFSYCGPELHLKGQAVLVGDAIHSVKPYFGLGVNSAFEDVIALDGFLKEALAAGGAKSEREENSGADVAAADLQGAFSRYSSSRAPEARDLVESQYSLDQPPDARFFLFFILPLLLDNAFHAALPSFFAPNLIALLQNEEYTFTEARRQKAQDRAVQFAVLGGLVAAALAALAGFPG